MVNEQAPANMDGLMGHLVQSLAKLPWLVTHERLPLVIGEILVPSRIETITFVFDHGSGPIPAGLPANVLEWLDAERKKAEDAIRAATIPEQFPHPDA